MKISQLLLNTVRAFVQKTMTYGDTSHRYPSVEERQRLQCLAKDSHFVAIRKVQIAFSPATTGSIDELKRSLLQDPKVLFALQNLVGRNVISDEMEDFVARMMEQMALEVNYYTMKEAREDKELAPYAYAALLFFSQVRDVIYQSPVPKLVRPLQTDSSSHS